MDIQTISNHVDIILYGVVIFALLCVFIPPNLQGWKNRHKPTITIRATVVGKEQNLSNAIYSGASSRISGDVYILNFRTAEGNGVTLTVPRDDYYNLKEGTAGILTYQGTKCEKFTPDKAK